MAESIKISQLQEVTKPLTNDYTVVVQNGYTYKTKLNSIRSSFEQSNIDIGTAVEKLSGDVEQISGDLSVAKDNIEYIQGVILSLPPENQITNLANNLNTLSTNTETSINQINASLNTIVEDLTPILEDPETLDSLTTVIALLSGEDGVAGIDEIAKKIAAMSSDVETIKGKLSDEIYPAISEITSKINVRASDPFFKAYSNESNSFVLNNYNKDYDFYYDKNRFPNHSIPHVRYSSSLMSGIVANVGTTIIFNYYDPSGKTFQPSFNDIENNYSETASYPSGPGASTPELSNVSIVSSIGISIDESNNRYDISSYYFTDGAGVVSLASTEYSDYPTNYPGEASFTLDIAPIRAGMFSLMAGNNALLLQAALSGNSDLTLYTAQGLLVKDRNGRIWKARLLTDVDQSLIADEKSIEENPSLHLILEKTIHGGSLVSMRTVGALTSMDSNEISSLSDIVEAFGIVSSDNRTIAGAISPIVLEYENKELTATIVEATTTQEYPYSENDLIETYLKCTVEGGTTGDNYTLSVGFMKSDGSGDTTWVTFESGSNPSINIDNAYTFPRTFTIDGIDQKITEGNDAVFYLIKGMDVVAESNLKEIRYERIPNED